MAANNGHVQCVELLIPVSNPKALGSKALGWAAENGHWECVELLIPVSDPKDRHSDALQVAAHEGHSRCVELLIPVSDPKALNCWALRWAAINGYTECVELLYPVSDPVEALNILQKDYPDDYSKWKTLYEMIEAERVRNTLNAEIGTSTVVKAQRKV